MKYSKKQLREKQKTQALLSRLVQDSQGLARPAAPPQEQAPVRAPKRGVQKNLPLPNRRRKADRLERKR